MAGRRFRPWLARGAALWLALGAAGACAADGGMVLAGARGAVTVSGQGGALVGWRTCRRACASPESALFTFGGDGRPVARIVAPRDAALDQRLAALTYRRVSGTPPDELRLRSQPLAPDVRLIQRLRLVDDGRGLLWSVELRGAGGAAFAREHRLAVRLTTGAEFADSESAGFTGWFESLRAVAVGPEGVRHLADRSAQSPMDAPAWAGLRNRFWGLLVDAGGAATLESESASGGSASLLVRPRDARGELHLRLFAGPVEPAALAGKDHGLTALWVNGLWQPLRWLALGLYWLLEALHAVLGQYGLAIIALALSVKLLMLPLTLLTGRWQEQVNVVRAILKPELDRIKADHRGERQAEEVMALHRRHGVTPWYPLKSLLGVLIQLPVFIGVFDMLLYHPGLLGAGFLWMEDLARPDRLLALPVALPFFGGYLNALPFLMTGINLVAARAASAAGRDPVTHRRNQLQLYGMALAFLVLFYTFPAGMVLYWTSTNLFHLLGEQLGHRLRRQ